MSVINPIQQLIRDMSFQEFVTRFISMLDMAQGKRMPVKLWPKQRKMCDLIESQKFKQLYILKCRQAGISELLAAYIIKIMIGEPESEIIVCSKDGGEAAYFLERRLLAQFEALPTFPGMTWPKIIQQTQTSFTLDNGSNVESLNTSADSGRGRTARLALIDEAAAKNIDMVAEDLYSSISPTIEKHPRGQLIYCSTSKPGSNFQNTVKKIINGEIKDISLGFLPWTCDPSRNQDWYQKERKKYSSEVNFLSEYPSKIQDILLSKSGLVYSNFISDPSRQDSHIQRLSPIWTDQLIVALDWGWRHNTGILFANYNPYQNHLYIFDELCGNETTVKDWSQQIKDKLDHYARQGAPKPYAQLCDGSIYNELDGNQSIGNQFRLQGIQFSKAKKSDEEGSRNMLIGRFQDNTITISPDCTNLIRELNTLKWKETKDGREKTESVGDDMIDPLRYICAHVWEQAPVVKPDPRKPREFNNKDYQALKDTAAWRMMKDAPLTDTEVDITNIFGAGMSL